MRHSSIRIRMERILFLNRTHMRIFKNVRYFVVRSFVHETYAVIFRSHFIVTSFVLSLHCEIMNS